jgi:hypothetical protein
VDLKALGELCERGETHIRSRKHDGGHRVTLLDYDC